jgi:hypothetical protein
MDRLILPAFRKGEFSAGILGGVRGFDAMGRQLALPTDQPWWTLPELTAAMPEQRWWALPAALAAVVLVLLVGLVGVARKGRRSWAWAAAAFVLGIFLSRTVGWARGGGDSGGGATGEW